MAHPQEYDKIFLDGEIDKDLISQAQTVLQDIPSTRFYRDNPYALFAFEGLEPHEITQRVVDLWLQVSCRAGKDLLFSDMKLRIERKPKE